jgi:cytochrome d ubiquinol oxidase subunit II
MTAAQALLVLGWLGLTMYALLGGADFGGGFWDAVAGEGPRGLARRGLIDHAIGPVWEANHVWLIFVLVLFWTCFPLVFASVLSTMYVPLTLVALGVIARGSAFAFRKAATELWQARLFGGAFAVSSVLTPFFLGTVAGALASGRVPEGGNGDAVGSWVNPTSALGGALAVLTCAFLAAVFLVAEARRRDEPELERWFRARARLAAAATGALALGGIAILHADAPRLFHQLLRPGLPLVLVSAAAGLAVLLLLPSGRPRLLQLLGALAVAAVVAGWGAAQYPYLLGTHTSIAATAAPTPTLWALTTVAAAAAVIVVPALGLLFTLQQRSRL